MDSGCAKVWNLFLSLDRMQIDHEFFKLVITRNFLRTHVLKDLSTKKFSSRNYFKRAYVN